MEMNEIIGKRLDVIRQAPTELRPMVEAFYAGDQSGMLVLSIGPNSGITCGAFTRHDAFADPDDYLTAIALLRYLEEAVRTALEELSYEDSGEEPSTYE